MNEDKKLLINQAMWAGLPTGCLLLLKDIIGVFAFRITDFSSPSLPIMLVTMIIGVGTPIFCIFYFTNKFNKDALEGRINYHFALNFGMFMFFFASLVYAMLAYIYCKFIDKEFIEFSSGIMHEIMKAQNITDNESMSEMSKMQKEMSAITPSEYAISSIYSTIMTGFMTCLVTSFYFREKKEKNSQDEL